MEYPNIDQISRQNILNNSFAIQKIEDSIIENCHPVMFRGQYVMLLVQVANFYNVAERTIERVINENKEELHNNGFFVVRGEELRDFKKEVTDIDVGNLGFAPQLSLFNIKAFLNIGMLLTDSKQAVKVRSLLLNATVSVINERVGGDTKYINQRDEYFLPSFYKNARYNQKFRDALKDYVTGSQSKYLIYTDKVYKLIFRERAKDYRRILELDKKDKMRDTLYSEVLNAVSVVENGVAENIKRESQQAARKLSIDEVDAMFEELESNPFLQPSIELARGQMVKFDNEFRKKEHKSIAEYMSPLEAEDYQRFLGEKSKQLKERIDENIALFERLKDK